MILKLVSRDWRQSMISGYITILMRRIPLNQSIVQLVYWNKRKIDTRTLCAWAYVCVLVCTKQLAESCIGFGTVSCWIVIQSNPISRVWMKYCTSWSDAVLIIALFIDRMQLVGSGSDYEYFLQVLGIPSLDCRYTWNRVSEHTAGILIYFYKFMIHLVLL